MEDTSTLAMRFQKEPIVPKNLPKPLVTSGTLAAAMGPTSGTAVTRDTSGSATSPEPVPPAATIPTTSSAAATTTSLNAKP